VSRVLLCSQIALRYFQQSTEPYDAFVKCNSFNANTLCNAATLTFDPLTLNIRSTSGVTWPKSVRNLSEIEQSPAELLTI